MAKGVFSLLEVRVEQVKNIANGDFASWPEDSPYGYLGGGFEVTPGSSAPRSYINRIDFSTEIFTNTGNFLPSARSLLGAVSSAYYGYFGGGASPGSPSTINTVTRFDFSSETASNPGKNLPSGRENLSATESSSYGYFGGGNTVPSTLINTISRLDLSTETVSDPGKNLPTATKDLVATSSNFYGYFGGGGDFPTPTFINTISRLDFSNETLSLPGNNLPFARKELAATSSNSYGYFGGGSIAPTTEVSTISKLDFSNETISNVANLPSARNFLTSAKNNYYGYFAGGSSQPASPNVISTTTRLNFSTETVSNTTNLPLLLRSSSTVLGGRSILRKNGFKTYGYFAGGTDPVLTPGVTSAISRLDFSTESVSSSNTLPDTGRNMGSIASNNYGYFAYGQGGGLPNSETYRLDFSNDSTLMVRYSISPRVDSSGFSSNSYGYFGGGEQPSFPKDSTISRFDFSNETYSNPGKNLSVARNSIATISNSSYGYFGGGNTSTSFGSGEKSLLSRLDFSNEVVTNLTPLPQERQDFSAGSNKSYAYFFAGQRPAGPPISSVNTSAIMRLDFSNDTASNISPRFPSARQNHTTVSADSYSYSGGGNVSPGLISTITRFNFNTETASNISNTLPQSLGVENASSVTNSN